MRQTSQTMVAVARIILSVRGSLKSNQPSVIATIGLTYENVVAIEGATFWLRKPKAVNPPTAITISEPEHGMAVWDALSAFCGCLGFKPVDEPLEVSVQPGASTELPCSVIRMA
jgi:hypothetical protein